jgi:Zn-dependent protease
MRFSRREVSELVIASIVMSIAFAFVMSNLFGSGFFAILLSLPIAAVSVSTAFVLHELAHKYMAQRYGCWAEFFFDKMWLVIGLFIAVFAGFVFMAPGAVVYHGNVSKKETGIIAAAGPLTNVVISLVALPFFFILIISDSIIIVYAGLIAYMVAFINIFLAAFNMIPFGDFDGLKIWRWSPGIYLGMVGIIAPIFIYVWVFV